MAFREKRLAWRKRRAQERELWIAQNPIVGSWRVLGQWKETNRGFAVLCECMCSKLRFVNFYDLKRMGSLACPSCAGKKRVERDKRENLLAFQKRCKKGGRARAKTVTSKYTKSELYLSRIMSGAKKRCSNKKFKNYHGRSIKFLFPDVETAARWIQENLGERPTKKHSIDRIDNDGHYEPGNLRWATAREQIRNRRASRKTEFGLRIGRLLAARPDYSYQGLRGLIKQGLSDADIITRVKSSSGRPRKRA
jgi:hypothetical protein